MRDRFKVSAVFIVLLVTLSALPMTASDVSETVLGKGLKVLVGEDHAAELVAIDIWVRAGTINETSENNGVSHFVEHLVFKGTKKRPQGQADLEMESLGATLDASTSRDWAHFRTTVASRYYKTALDVLADAIMNAAFKRDDVESERAVILDEIAKRDEDPLDLTENLFHKTAYKEHPYRLEVEGARESIKKLTRGDILDYYNTYYVSNNMTVVVVGDVDKADAVSAVGSCFAGFDRRDLPKRSIAPESKQNEVRRAHIEKPLKQTHMMIGFHAPGISEAEDVYAMDILLSYLGVGYRSWLSVELKDRQGLIVQGTGDFLTQKDPSVIALYAAVEPENEDKVEAAILNKVKDLQETPISDFDLARARRSLEGNFAFEGETYSGRANALGFYDMLSSYKFAVDYISNIRKVTAADVQRVVHKYLNPDRAVIIKIGPKRTAE